MRIDQTTTGRHWDSALNVNTDELTLNFRVRLIQITPASTSQGGLHIHNGVLNDGGERFTLLPWELGEWGNYQRQFTRVVEQAWNDRLWLYPNMPWYQSHPAASVETKRFGCRLSLTLTDDNPHVTFRCIKVGTGHRGNGFRSWASDQQRRGVLTHNDLRPEQFAYDSGDAVVRGRPTNLTPYQSRQTTVAHEFGHILRLGHVREGLVGCVADTNAVVCYGRIHQERDDIMGTGDQVLPRHARPWTRTLGLHLHPQTARDRRLRWTPLLSPVAFVIYSVDGQPPRPGGRIPTPIL